MKTRGFILYGMIAAFCCISCKSVTAISTTTPGAKVYIGNKYKGTTPYVYGDYLPTGFSRKVKIEKDGYQAVEGKIRKLGRVNPMAVYGVLWGGVPILWAGGYKRFYEYELVPENGGSAVRSDYLKFGESFTTSKRALPVYVGNADGYYYIYAAGFLHALNPDLSLNHSIELGEKNSSIPIDGYFAGEDKRVVEFFADDNSVKITSISPNNKSSEFVVKDVRYLDEVFSEDYCYGYKRNSKTNNFICYSEKTINSFDSDLTKRDTYQSEKKIIESYLLADERILSLEIAGNGLFLCLRKDGNETYYEVTVDRNYDARFFRLNVNEETGNCYVSSLIGVTSKDEFNPSGVQVLTYDLATIGQVSTKNVFFNEGVMSSKNEYLVNKGVQADKENVFVLLEEQWVTVTTSSSGSSSSSSTTAGLIIVNAGKESTPQQRISKLVTSSVHQDKLSFQSQLKDGRLYFVFNTTVGGKPILNQAVLDADLQLISWDLRDTYKEEGTVFHGLKGYEMEDGRKFLFHQYKTKLGVAISEF